VVVAFGVTMVAVAVAFAVELVHGTADDVSFADSAVDVLLASVHHAVVVALVVAAAVVFSGAETDVALPPSGVVVVVVVAFSV
jgi:hypothetical protein